MFQCGPNQYLRPRTASTKRPDYIRHAECRREPSDEHGTEDRFVPRDERRGRQSGEPLPGGGVRPRAAVAVRYQVDSRPQEMNLVSRRGASLIMPFLLWQATHIETGFPTGWHVLSFTSCSWPSSTGTESP